MNKRTIAKLEELGLNNKESSVYLSLLKKKQAGASDIGKDTTFCRSVVYDILDRLIEKKLVVKIRRRDKVYFQPTSPAKLLEETEAKMELAKELVPELKNIFDSELPEIVVHEGKEAFCRFWLDSYKRMPIGTVDYVSGSIGSRWTEFFGSEMQKLMSIKKKRKIKWKAILFERDPWEKNVADRDPRLNEFRIIKNRSKNIYGNFNIFGDERIVLQSATEPLIIEIKNKTLIKVFQNIFDILWSIGDRF